MLLETIDTSLFSRETLYSSRFIHLATQLPSHALAWMKLIGDHPGVSFDTFESFVKEYPEQTVLVLSRAKIIFTNEEELNTLRSFGLSFNQPTIIKLGPKGVIYRDLNHEFNIPAPTVNAVETTGAGDVLAGACLALLAEGLTIPSSLERGVKLASQSVTDFGVDHLLK